ncbi:MAG: tetratricopeptide repeat protein, partial [Gemmatimonadota bacterium]
TLAPTPAAAQQDDGSVSLTDTIPDADLAAMIETGAELFNGGTCIICHAVGGRSDGDRAPDFTDVEWLHSDGSFEGIFQTILWGVKRDEMKAVAPRPFFMAPSGGMSLTGSERQAVAAYVWSLGPDRRDRLPPRVVAQNEFLELLERGETDAAKALFERESRGGPESLLFDERAINRLGYEYLRRGASPVAIEILELNTELHPDSWNVWDSLGEAHMTAGNRRRAIELYEKSLELNPENDNAREKLAELRRG